MLYILRPRTLLRPEIITGHLTDNPRVLTSITPLTRIRDDPWETDDSDP
jgi:hypothetical protein